jgi:hypothetical protein
MIGVAGVIETAKVKTVTRSSYRLSAPRDGSFAHGAPQWAWKDDRMEPSRIESAQASARWALR